MKKRIVAIALTFVIALGLCACGSTSGNETTAVNTEASGTVTTEESTATRSFTDSCGRTVELPENITRVVVTGPLAQIAVFFTGTR